MARKKTASRSTLSAVRKTPTGISGFDEMLEGGVPRGRALLIAGAAGAGKTVFMNEFLYRGIQAFGEPGVLVTFEESPDDIAHNVAGFGWDYAGLIRARRLAIVDATPPAGTERETDGEYDLEPLFLRIRAAARRVRAKRLVLDGMEGLYARLSNEDAVRDLLLRLSAEARSLGLTTMVAAERLASGATRHGVEDFVVDGVVDLAAEPGQQKTVRRIVVRKMRGVGYRSGVVEFDIGPRGLEVFPKLPVDRSMARTRPEIRRAFGIPKFDEMIGGGIPEGYMALVSGNTGTGKSTFMQHFVAEGARLREPVVFVALEEPSGQVRSLAARHGWRFKAWENAGLLRLLDVPLIDIRSDEVMYRIAHAVRELGAKRLVIDSVSSLKSATMDSEKVRQFLIQLSEYAKSSGVTCAMTYLVPVAFGAEKGQLMSAMSSNDARLSSAVDCLILQRYVERDRTVRKLITVLKMRGVAHDTAIHSYDIGPKGVVIGEPFEE